MREALGLFGEYQRTGDQPSLVRAVPVFRAALAAAVRVGGPDISSYHNNLGYALRELAVATSDAAAQAESVRCLRAAVAAVDSDDPDRAAYLCSLSSGLRDLYGYTGDAELLRTAVQVATAATESDSLEPSLATQYAVLAGALEDLYTHQADSAVLTELIAAYREAASYAELLDEPGLAAHWNSLGSWLRERYERSPRACGTAGRRWRPHRATSTSVTCRTSATTSGWSSSGPAIWTHSPRRWRPTAWRSRVRGPVTRTCRAAPLTCRAP